jgi:membrane-associated phospholipid phosphatase
MKIFKLAIPCLLATCRLAAQSNSLDNQTLYEMMEHRNHEHTEFEQHISNTTNYISLAIPISILANGLLRGDKITLQKGVYIGESIVISSLFTYALKVSINRPRPFKTNPVLIAEGSAGSPSFPSGHTSEAFSTATALSIGYPKWYVIVPAYAWAGSVAYSRMYLGVHYPTDVIAGAVTGAGSAWLTYKANKWIHHDKKHDPKSWW